MRQIRPTRRATPISSVVERKKEMKREFLKELGLEDEVVDKVMAEHGKTVESHKSLVAEKEKAIEASQSTIKGLQETVKAFDGVNVEELKTKMATAESDYQKQLDELKTNYEKELSDTKLNGALETALLGAKVKNTKAFKALLDMDLIKMKDDTLQGLDEQVNKLKESDAYLFEEAKSGTKVGSGRTHEEGGTGDKDDALRQAFGLPVKKG